MDLSPYRKAVIDDSQTARGAARVILEQEGAELVEEVDGLAAVVAKRPDPVLVDIMMPRPDCLQLTAILKGHSEMRQLPVVLVSRKQSLFDQARSKLMGAGGYLVKPFSAEELLTMVRSALPRSDDQVASIGR